MFMGGPLKAPALSGGTGAVAGKAHVESGGAEAIDGAFSGGGGNLKTQLRRARPHSVEAKKRAAAVVPFRGEKEPARCDKIERLLRRRDRAENESPRQRQRLLRRPQRVDLRSRRGDEERVKIDPELRKTLRIRSAMLGEGMFRRGENEKPILRRAPGEGDREAERCDLLARCGRRRLDETPHLLRARRRLKKGKARLFGVPSLEKGGTGACGDRDLGNGAHGKT